MRSPATLAATLLLLALAPGCATVVSGRTQTLRIESTPAGARVRRNGVTLGRTPCEVELPRFAESELVIAREGYAPRTVEVERAINSAVFLDLPLLLIGVLPGVAALTVDATTGAIFELYPGTIQVDLDPSPGPVYRRDPAHEEERGAQRSK